MKIEEHKYKVRVYHQDTDAAGIVHHCAYLKFLERARSEALLSYGYSLSELLDKYDVQFAIHHLEVDYIKAVPLDTELTILTACQPLRHTALAFSQNIYTMAAEETIILRAKLDLVCLGRDLRPKRLPNIVKRG